MVQEVIIGVLPTDVMCTSDAAPQKWSSELCLALMKCLELPSAMDCSYGACDTVKMVQLNLRDGCESKSSYMSVSSAVELVLPLLEAGFLYNMQYEKF